MKKFIKLMQSGRFKTFVPRIITRYHLKVVERPNRPLLVRRESYELLVNDKRVYFFNPEHRVITFKRNLYGIYSSCLHKLRTIMEVDSNKSVSSSPIDPPISTKGMKKLDKSAFVKQCKFPGLKVEFKSVGKVRKKLKHTLAKIPKLKSVAELSDVDPNRDTHKLFVLDPTKIKTMDDFSEEEVEAMKECDIDTTTLQWYDIELGYDNWGASEIIRAILPEEIEYNVSGFSTIGHIAHLNLKDEVLDYKYIIGEVLLDKHVPIRTVVNKLNIIDNTFRNFQMELLAGEEDYIAIAKENGCSFEFDFSKVYWNSRLGSEHQRLVNLMNKGDVLYDVFAGVGPFAIPAAKKGVTVIANDLNPESYKSLKSNIKLNKIKSEVQTFNMDGREFIRTVIKDDFLKRISSVSEKSGMGKVHVAMNLPAMALEFLDAWKSIYNKSDIPSSLSLDLVEELLPTVHCYCFTKSADVEKDVTERAEGILGMDLPDGHRVRYVRNVAPNKEMMCLSFKLSLDLVLDGLEEPELKRQKVNQ